MIDVMKKSNCTPMHGITSKRSVFQPLYRFLILFCFASSSLTGQTWLYTYPGTGTGFDIVEATNGDVLTMGFINGGSNTGVTRINPEGDMVWQLDFPSAVSTWAPAIINTPDGNYVAAYQDSVLVDNQLNDGVVLQKFDDAGNSIWEVAHAHPTRNIGNIRSLTQSNDGGFLLAGIFGDSYDAYLLKIDADGALEWMQEYPGLWLIRAIQLENGDLIFSGNSNTSGAYFATMYRTDSAGNIIWTKTFGEADINNFGATVMETNDNQIAYLLFQGDVDSISLIKMDTAGEELWSTSYYTGMAVAEGSSKLLFQDDSGTYSIANLRGFSPGGTPIVQIDENGTLLSSNIVTGINNFIAAITPLSGGGYAFSGSRWIQGQGAQLVVGRTNAQGLIPYGTVQGNVFHDENASCAWEMDEPSLSQWVVTATDMVNQNTYSASTDSLGNYELPLFEGDYEVTLIPPVPLWQVCPDSAVQVINVDPEGNAPGPYQADFPVEVLIECPVLSVDISIPFLRRCFDNTYTVNYCNIGTETATEVYIEVVLDDFMAFDAASIAYENQMDTLLLFQIGEVGIGECGQFTITANIDCDSTFLGQTHCSSATIYPHDFCLPFEGDWDMSSIELDGYCENDSVYFEITNTGTGNMAAPLDYVIVIDEVIMFNGDFQLASSETRTVAIEATGETYRLEAEQAPNHPESTEVSFTLDGCPEFGVAGFVNSFPLNDFLGYEDIDCQPNNGAYDPNDKKAFPRGYGATHAIERNTEIEYLVRFQNTGTDTAFQVVVRDSLSGHLDLNTFRMGVSSHPCVWSIDQNILKVVFNDIMLPDSNVNEAASHGFFKFSIWPKATVEYGTVIENTAGIYFDFNAPIITNTVFHTVDTNFVLIDGLTLDREVDPNVSIKVFPNPLKTEGHFALGDQYYQSLKLEVYNSMGQLVKQQPGSGNHLIMPAAGLSKGLYFFRLYGDGKILGTGQLVLVE